MPKIAAGRLAVEVPEPIARDYLLRVELLQRMVGPVTRMIHTEDGKFEASVSNSKGNSFIVSVNDNELPAAVWAAEASLHWRHIRGQAGQWVDNGIIDIMSEMLLYEWTMIGFKETELYKWLEEQDIQFRTETVHDTALLLTLDSQCDADYFRAAYLGITIGRKH